MGPVVDAESTSGVGPILGVCSQLEGAGPHRWARFLIQVEHGDLADSC